MRLFFGLSLPGEIRRCAAAHARSLESRFPGRYVLPENYHITLAFIGHVPDERMPDVQAILQQSIRNVPPPLLTLGDTGFFGRRDRAIVVIRVHDSPSLLPVHDALIRALDEACLPADHGPFSPHITLARHVSLPPDPLEACPAASFSPSMAHLYLSARDNENILRYTPVYTAPFSI